MDDGDHTNLREVSEETRKLLEDKCTRSVPNDQRLKIRNNYPLPRVPATRTPQMDSYLKPEVPTSVKSLDKELAKVQSFVLDTLAPLSALVETTKKEEVTIEEVTDAATCAIQLLGNANAQISRLRREKITSSLNKTLVPLSQDDSNFVGAAPSLFGAEFAKKAKDHVDQVKALRAIVPPQEG